MTASAQPLRALVIGAGAMADNMHLPIMSCLRDEREIKLVQVCDIQRERAAAARRKFGFTEDGGDAMSAIERPDIDAVYIFGSAQMHYELGMRALAQRKHLFVEKPVAPSFAEVRQMAQAAHARGLIAVGGHNRRFYRSLAALRAHSGRAGWRYAEAVFHKPISALRAPFGARNWLAGNGIHALDALLFAMGGLPCQISTVADSADPATANAFSAVMRWNDGRQAVFLCNNNAGARREEYVFHGSGETHRLSEATLIMEKDGRTTKRTFPAGDDSFIAEHHAFLSAIQSGEEPLHSLARIAPSLFLCELIERSFSGRVSLPVALSIVAPARHAPGKSILVVQPEKLLPALATVMPDFRLVSLEDIRESAGDRHNVVGAILGHGAAPLTDDILAKLPALTVVGVAGLSLARYRPDALLARGITLLNASAAYAGSVAEFALALAILGRRRAFTSHEIMRSGGWGVLQSPSGAIAQVKQAVRPLRPLLKAVGLNPFLVRAKHVLQPSNGGQRVGVSRSLQGATVGLLGWGANARAFAEHLQRFQTRILVFSEHASAGAIRDAGAIPASLGDVLASDVVSLHRGLTHATRHFLGAAELAKLRPGAVLINIARGGLIDPDALVARLQQGDVFACLDTFEDEPLPASHPIRALPNVFLTSHIAGGSPDMHAAAADEVVRKLADFLDGGRTGTLSAERLRNMT